jgi:4-alpha-glucanotransferase
MAKVKKLQCPETWLRERAAGVFLHISSLPSRQGIGCLGKEAREWIDFLSESGFRYWQFCPIGPTGFGDSPYQTFSSLAGNPYFIDLYDLIQRGYLQAEDLRPLEALPTGHVDYGRLYVQFPSKLEKAFRRFLELKHDESSAFSSFCEEESSWLPIYSLFTALKEFFNGQSFDQWPECFQNPGKITDSFIKTALNKNQDLLFLYKKHCFIQFIFRQQWLHLRQYAHSKGISLIGDIPIFLGLDSADFWGYRSIFQTDENGKAQWVAGVPPDAFSKKGQLWGNPLFDWEVLKKEGYSWWIQRFRQAQRFFDIVRIDHFRGFYNYWAIPSQSPDARRGRWRKGPGIRFFQEIFQEMSDLKCIAEDLGILSLGVYRFIKASHLPGMNILQFAFDGHSQNAYLPHMHEKNSVLYLGTHDNDTTHGWYAALSAEKQDYVRRYFRSDGSSIAWDMIRWAYASPCRLLILSLQDLLSLGSEARLNTPSTRSGNWTWRCPAEALWKLRDHSKNYLRELAHLYGRDGKNA